MTDKQENESSGIIGSYLSLITKAEARYEGTLVQVDRVNKIMTLKGVKTMGTEGRRNGVNEMPANDSVMAQVKFRVDLIKTFDIINRPEEPTESKDDPAIIEQEESP